MRVCSFDTETYLFSPGNRAPKPVCCTAWWGGYQPPVLMTPDDPGVEALWADQEAHFVGANIAYDIGVMLRWHPRLIPAVVRALDEGRVWDIQIRHQLLHLARDGHIGFPKRISQAKLETIYLGIDRSSQKKGDDIWRLEYGTLDGALFNEWPMEAINYALEDAVNCWKVFAAQGGPVNELPTEQIQIRAAVSLHLTSVWGMRTNQAVVQKHYAELTAKKQSKEQELKQATLVGEGSQEKLQGTVQAAWLDYHIDEVKDMAEKWTIGINEQRIREMVKNSDLATVLKQNTEVARDWCWNAQEYCPKDFVDYVKKSLVEAPRTKTGFSTAEEDLEPLCEDVPLLKQRAEFKHLEKMLSTYVEPYMNVPSVHSEYNAVVTTGRTSSEKPNTQNIPGEFRDNVQPRPGTVFGVVDYSGIEMVTLAATIKKRYGSSKMGDAINQGIDLHSMTASGLNGVPYDEIKAKAKAKEEPFKSMRQGAKACNFGIPGGLGTKAFIAYAKSNYGVEFAFNEARDKIKNWKNQIWPEVGVYLNDNADVVDHGGGVGTAINNLGREKANCSYTQFSNYTFQSLAADGAKMAMWELIKAQLLGWYWTFGPYQDRNYGGIVYRGNPLAGSHLVNFIHDELVMEHPLDQKDAAFKMQQEIMVREMSKVTEGIRVTVEGKLGPKWEH